MMFAAADYVCVNLGPHDPRHRHGLSFATPEAPAALHAGFNELVEAIRPHADDDDLGLLTELLWAALHGLATLTRSGRLPREQHERRLGFAAGAIPMNGRKTTSRQ